jgi:DNA-binding HxlR family transcriptional regulator
MLVQILYQAEVPMKKSVSGCPVEDAMRVLGGRWRAVLVFYLLDGPKRFSDLRRDMPGISQRMLTLDLRALESAGLVSRTVYPEVPVRVEYRLTPEGRLLRPTINELCKLGKMFNRTGALVST